MGSEAGTFNPHAKLCGAPGWAKHPRAPPVRPAYIRRMPSAPCVVGIAGGSGSGKTSLIRAIQRRFSEGAVSVVSQDNYYRLREEQALDANGRVNYDVPGAVDLDALAEDLLHLHAGRGIRRREYTFNQEGRVGGWVETLPGGIVLVEGLFILHHVAVRDLLDVKVFVHAGEDQQLQRRLLRDARERGYGEEEVLYQWHHHVLPAYRAYLLPHRMMCDVVLNNDGAFEPAVGALEAHLRALLAEEQEAPQPA